MHIDKNSEIELFKNEIESFQNVTFVEKREDGIWGDIGLVKATINALRQILRDGRKGYCVLLSGQDYPIKRNDEINSFFEYNYGKEFIEIFSIPAGCWLSDGMDRLEKYKINLSFKRGNYIQVPSVYETQFYTRKNLKKIYRLIISKKYHYILTVFKRRKFPRYIKPYGGSQWWALTIETVCKIVRFLDNHPDYIKYHKYSLIPDEIFFQSIVMNLIENGVKIEVKPSIMHINWERKDVDLPVIFSSLDFQELYSQPDFKLFARKFDIVVDSNILNKIDSWHKKVGF